MNNQLSIFGDGKEGKESKKPDKQRSEWGTFKDSLKAPVHRWFTYLQVFPIRPYDIVLKERTFMGVKQYMTHLWVVGLQMLLQRQWASIRMELKLIQWSLELQEQKMEWEVDGQELFSFLDSLKSVVSNVRSNLPKDLPIVLKDLFPELLMKCFLDETLYELFHIREFVYQSSVSKKLKSFLEVGLIATLRDVSIAATGWPYIAPNKVKVTSMSKKGFETYHDKLLMMYSDIQDLSKQSQGQDSLHHLIHGDSRNTSGEIPEKSVDHIFTSPPYLNNFDYADRTRLEMYFTGEAKDWGEISSKVRTQLITCATTQISRTDPKFVLSENFREACPDICKFLDNAVERLGELRKVKGGKKSYDLMVVGYFNDIFNVLCDNYRVMKAGASAVYVLGDSAPYGVHIPTDELIGKIAERVGFKGYDLTVLRKRGDKWKDNPQRHGVLLQESLVRFTK